MKKQSIARTGLIIASLILLTACQQAKPADTKPGAMTVKSEPVTPGSVNPADLPQKVMVTQQDGTVVPIVAANSEQISMTNNEFIPRELTIKVGTTVIFVNQDDTLHWPASDAHPVHNICPGLDALKGLAKGETFEFTFDKPMFCPIHDHLNPAMRGMISIVQ